MTKTAVKKKPRATKVVPQHQIKLVYDVKSVPPGLGIANMIKVYEQHKVVFWDSDLGVKPQFFMGHGVMAAKQMPLIVDTKGREVDFDLYQREFDDAQVWDKEMYNCTHSPIYYFTNYGTTVYPATADDTRKFLAGIGMKDIPITDSAKAKKAWDKQKEAVAKAMKFITMDHLKERKAALDVIKATYKEKVLALEQLLKNEVDLFNAKGEPHPDQKRLSNVVGKIKLFPVPEKYAQYRNKKRKWDSPMLFNTNYALLLEIYYEIRPNKNKSNLIGLDGEPEKLGGAIIHAE